MNRQPQSDSVLGDVHSPALLRWREKPGRSQQVRAPLSRWRTLSLDTRFEPCLDTWGAAAALVNTKALLRGAFVLVQTPQRHGATTPSLVAVCGPAAVVLRG